MSRVGKAGCRYYYAEKGVEILDVLGVERLGEIELDYKGGKCNHMPENVLCSSRVS